MNRIEIELNSPVELDGVKYEVLEMREPKVRDSELFESLKGTDAQKEIQMFANLCDTTPELIRELTLKDYGKLQIAYKDFL